MNGYDATGRPETNATPELSAPENSGVDGAEPESGSAEQELRSRRLLPRGKSRWIVAGVAVCAVAGVSIGLAATSQSGSTTSSSASAGNGAATGGAGSGGGSNARSGPAAGGSSGTVTSVSTSGFTLTTSAGQKVTVNETSSTAYQDGTGSAAADAVTSGESVLVLGTTDSTTITATQVTVQSTGATTASATSSAAAVIPFQKGTTSSSEQVGQIPTDYTEGQGTLMSGTVANDATEAALAAYPGGVVDRVVQLANGEYEVHYIGVNWPHHIFVNESYQVVGAD